MAANDRARAAASHLPGSAGASTGKPPILALERDYQRTILDAAQLLGWRTAHFRPARTNHGWRTPVEGDGKGFPDLFLVHPHVRQGRFAEVKRDDRPRLDVDQEAWRLALIAAGFIHDVVLVPSGLDGYVKTLHDVATSRSRT